jgi:hypothetical protein
MQMHRVWEKNAAAFELAVQLMAAAQPQLAAIGLWVAESMMRRDDGARWGGSSCTGLWVCGMSRKTQAMPLLYV